MTKKRTEIFKWLQRITSPTTVLEINSWGQDFSLQLTPNGKSFCRSLKERHTIQNSGQLNNGRKTLLVQLLTLKPQQKYKAPNSSSCVCLYFSRTLKLCYIPSIIFLTLEDLYFLMLLYLFNLKPVLKFKAGLSDKSLHKSKRFHPFIFYTRFLQHSGLRGSAESYPSCHGARGQFIAGPQTNKHPFTLMHTRLQTI